jgi:hypothetical protein
MILHSKCITCIQPHMHTDSYSMGRLNDEPGYFVPIMKLGDSGEVESLTQKLLGPSLQL